MAKRHNVEDYDWAMYVDAAGDDGFSYEKGSSLTYTVNCFMCETSQIAFNQSILNRIKTLSRCRVTDEMKSGTIIRSKHRSELCDELAMLNGALFQLVIFKKGIDRTTVTTEQREKHVLSTLAHSFTINMAMRFHKHHNKSLCIIIDNMKEAEILGTREAIEQELVGLKHTVIFADSKSAQHSLLQISDFFAGLTNRACMDHEIEAVINPSINRCSPCMRKKNLCRGKPESLQTELFFDILHYSNLYIRWVDLAPTLIVGNGLRLSPLHFEKRYQFVNCGLRKKYKRHNK